ncbi:hypothetical protein OG372_04260 [Streptomyces sp. NBC_01020]|uniref:hypothetical protein n=1 Tax=unclassified Streptomyces TaxID=2593676 RepID=UPI0032524279|nr:hypothetical protein OG372_04260 [Streptomyces sp. NBC_01020]
MFDRAVVRLVDNRVLLPGITTLTRQVAGVRATENAAPYRTLNEAVPDGPRQTMPDPLKAPDGKSVSELEHLRTPPISPLASGAHEQEFAAMHDLAVRHTAVRLDMPDSRGVVARIDSEQRNADAKHQS